MRIQYAVICHDFEDGEWHGVVNLRAVHHKLYAGLPIETADGVAKPFPLRLVVSLIEGSIGPHRLWVNVRGPDGQAQARVPALDIDWTADSPTFYAIFEIALEARGDGIYEFHVLGDGEPLGSVPLPAEFTPVPVAST